MRNALGILLLPAARRVRPSPFLSLVLGSGRKSGGGTRIRTCISGIQLLTQPLSRIRNWLQHAGDQEVDALFRTSHGKGSDTSIPVTYSTCGQWLLMDLLLQLRSRTCRRRGCRQVRIRSSGTHLPIRQRVRDMYSGSGWIF